MSVGQSQSESIGKTGIATDEVTVAGLSQALARGKLTAAELTQFYLGRIERLNGDYGAVISVDETAGRQAAAADAARAAGQEPGPLAGIPVLVKDNVSVAGSPATAGSPALLGADARDAFLIGRLREAGAVILGKANLSEWANFRSNHSSSGWSTLGGQAVNPNGPGRNPSGSSSGSGVAVAAGLTPLAIGTETDGSIISPSTSNGIVGIKPTLGLVSRSGIVPISAAQDTAGPMTRCVADAAVLLGAIAGADPADPQSEDTPDGAAFHADYTQFLDPAALAGARIGVWRDGAADAIPAALAVFDQAVSLLREAGAVIIDPVSLTGAQDISKPEFTALGMEFKDDLNAYLASVGGEHPMSLSELIEFNEKNALRVLSHFGQEIFVQAQETKGRADPNWRPAREEARTLARGALDGAFADHGLDAVVIVSGNPAWLTDYVLGDNYSFGTSTPCAVSGYPSITVPAGHVSGLGRQTQQVRSADFSPQIALPVGLSFMGLAWSEPRLLGLAYAFEQVRSLR
jgi:amidase